MDALPIPLDDSPQRPLQEVFDFITSQPDGEERIARVFRYTFDQLYDGQRTGRYKWDQLYKTEKTHYGTLFEINLQREFDFHSGNILDYSIAGHEVDCKYSASSQWMLPPEVRGRLFLACQADDQTSRWSLGLIEAKPEYLRSSTNRDAKTSLNPAGRSAIHWLFKDAPMPPNVLLQIPEEHANRLVTGSPSGQRRVDDLFRSLPEQRITRNVLATVAQQQDYMKRARYNGGARSNLAPEGFIILSGDYRAQADVAQALGLERPLAGELMSVRVGPTDDEVEFSVRLGGQWWRRLTDDEVATATAPIVEDRGGRIKIPLRSGPNPD